MEKNYRIKLLFIFIFIFILIINGNLIGQDIDQYFVSDSIACDTFPPPRNLDGYAQDDAVRLWWEMPQSFDTIVPQNLIGYNLYRDDEFLNYISYQGGDTTFYWDLELWWQGCYDYTVTALYDMSLCGLPADTIESELSNVKTICIEFCPLFPFYENWNTGSFDPNLWDHENNWMISADYGYPWPCAVFDGSQLNSNYASRLTSYGHDCKFQAGSSNPYIDGDIYLEFDIKLNDLDTCGIDRMKVQYTDTSMVFHTIVEYSDSAGSFIWTHQKINMTSYAKGKWVKLAFLAEGEGGSIININNWYIDNIEFYRQCNPPRDLQWVVYDEIFAWSPPLPHTVTKDQNNKEFQGYDIYAKEGGYEFLEFTTDTFYVPDQSYEAYYVTAVYEDCEPASNELWGHVDIDEISDQSEIKIYPNPANDQITIEAVNKISSLKLIDINGKALICLEPDNNKSRINTSSLSNGIYFIEINMGKEVVRRKVVVHH